MEQLRLIGKAIGRSVTTGRWRGHGPADEHLTQIADNLSRARHLVDPHGRPSEPVNPDWNADTPHPHSQVMHTLYVAAHGMLVALGAYVTDLQRRLEIATRRPQPMAERPTALEITAARGVMARFAGFEQLAAAYMFGQPLPSADPGQLRAAAPATRLETALAAWEIQAHRTLAARPDPADLVRVARVQALITSTTSIVPEAAAITGHIDSHPLQRLAPTLEANQVAWTRLAKRWGELTSPASRTDPALVAGLPALLYLSDLGRHATIAAGLLQATSLPFLVTAATIGMQVGMISSVTGAALICAGLLSVVIFPAAALSRLRELAHPSASSTLASPSDASARSEAM